MLALLVNKGCRKKVSKQNEIKPVSNKVPHEKTGYAIRFTNKHQAARICFGLRRCFDISTFPEDSAKKGYAQRGRFPITTLSPNTQAPRTNPAHTHTRSSAASPTPADKQLRQA